MAGLSVGLYKLGLFARRSRRPRVDVVKFILGTFSVLLASALRRNNKGDKEKPCDNDGKKSL
jgi:hypothetical protein